MSSEAIGHVFRHAEYSGAQLAILLAIADSANDQNHNEIWMAVGTLAVKARVNRDTARRALATFVQDGWLELLAVGGGRGNSTRYRFQFVERAVVYNT